MIDTSPLFSYKKGAQRFITTIQSIYCFQILVGTVQSFMPELIEWNCGQRYSATTCSLRQMMEIENQGLHEHTFILIQIQ